MEAWVRRRAGLRVRQRWGVVGVAWVWAVRVVVLILAAVAD